MISPTNFYKASQLICFICPFGADAEYIALVSELDEALGFRDDLLDFHRRLVSKDQAGAFNVLEDRESYEVLSVVRDEVWELNG